MSVCVTVFATIVFGTIVFATIVFGRIVFATIVFGNDTVSLPALAFDCHAAARSRRCLMLLDTAAAA